MERNKQEIIEKLRENGCRITKQRLALLDIILEGKCTSCKEIFYKASDLILREFRKMYGEFTKLGLVRITFPVEEIFTVELGK